MSSNTTKAWLRPCLPVPNVRLSTAGISKAPDGSFWVAHRGDRVRDAPTDEADGAGRSVSLPKAAAQSQASAPVQGPALLHIDADTGEVLQARLRNCCLPRSGRASNLSRL